ncbi:hypothetical protein WA556_001270, partial [Blastocystis sp. ATCC 50177/Nand II]
LQARAVRWLSELRKADLYPYDGVKVSTTFWSFQQWYERILSHFDDAFFLPSTPHGAYYCDCVGQQDPKAGRQLRPNFVVAMAVMPALFVPEHATQALDTARVLFDEPLQLGVKTLAPWDPQYRGYYDNAKPFESDLSVCGGWSYHNGPEWVWVTGFWVQALLQFPPREVGNKEEMRLYCFGLVKELMNYIRNDDWFSLPEMTNRNGEYNGFSCRAQAWSVGSLLWAMEAVQNVQ